MELRISESLDANAREITAFRKELHDVAITGHAAIQSNQYAGLFAVSFPILDIENHAVAALTVPMLPRIDAVVQASRDTVIAGLRAAAEKLEHRIR